MATSREKNTAAEKELNRRISANLRRLIKEKNTNISCVCKALEEKGQISTDRTAFSKFLNHPEDNRITLPFLISCADHFEVPVDAILSRDVTEYLNLRSEEEAKGHQPILDWAEILDRRISQSKKKPEEQQMFVNNPDSPLFTGYLQTPFYCYYYSTVSDEYHNTEMPIIEGKLTISPHENECRVEFLVDTKKKDALGKTNYKKYVGTAVLSTATNAVHCALRENNIGEYCYIIFRYVKVNFGLQDCRMAVVLSTSSTPENRDPVLHRMFMSRQKISTEHLKLIAPYLRIDYSPLIIPQEALTKLQEVSEKYAAAVQVLMELECLKIYTLDKNRVQHMVSGILTTDEWNAFYSELSSFAAGIYYHKINPEVDRTVRELLVAAGYYA